MIHRMRPSRQRLWAFVGASAMLAFVLALTISCTSSSSDAVPTAGTAPPAEAQILGSAYIYDGPASIEERIAESDVIVRVRLNSVSSGAELQDFDNDGMVENVSALVHTFEALEYLKGSGGSELVAVAYAFRPHETSQSAIEDANALHAERDTTWDGREAIVFLVNGPRQNDRYLFGWYNGGSDAFNKDYYTIASIHSKKLAARSKRIRHERCQNTSRRQSTLFPRRAGVRHGRGVRSVWPD